MEPEKTDEKDTNNVMESEGSRGSVEPEHDESEKGSVEVEHDESEKDSVEVEKADNKNAAVNDEERVIAPPEEITTDVAKAEEKQKARAKENARRAQLVYPAKPEHEDPRKQKKSRFAGFGKKFTKFLSVLIIVLFLAVVGLMVFRNLNANYVGAERFVLIGTQPNMALGSETYVFDDYSEYVKKTMGAGGLKEEDFANAKYGLVSIPYQNCGEMEEVLEVKGAELQENVMRVKVEQKKTCEEGGRCMRIIYFRLVKGLTSRR